MYEFYGHKGDAAPLAPFSGRTRQKAIAKYNFPFH